MTSSRTPRRSTVPFGRRAPAAGLLALVVLSGACEDAESDPLAGLAAGEAQAGLLLGVRLADPLEGVADDGLSVEESVALEAWKESWDLEPGRAVAAREGAYPVLAESVVRHGGPDSLGLRIERLNEAVARALIVGGRTLPEQLSSGLRTAYDGLAEATVSMARGEHGPAAERMLRATDALRGISPEAVARALVAEVEDRFGRISGDDPYTEQEMERADRLVRGARQALDARDWVLAIRRAYYARGLMDAKP